MRFRRSWPFAVYAACALLLFSQLLRHLTSASYGGNDADLFTWWLRATPTALLHGKLPFDSQYLFYPGGINAMWNTSVIAVGVVMTPVTLLAGPLASLNIMLIAAPALSAWVSYRLARRYFRTGPSVLCGFLYGFSPYVLGQASHLHLTLALFPPFLLGLLLEAVVHQRARPIRLGLLLGGAIAVQLLIAEEVLATSALLAAMTLSVLAVCFPRRLLEGWRYLMRVATVAAVTAALLDGWPLYVQFFGPQRPVGAIQAQHPGADLLTFGVPTRLQLLHQYHPGRLVQVVIGSNLSEQTAYLGLPLLILIVVAIYRLRGTGWSWLGLPLGLGFLLSLGSRLTIGGHVTSVRLPAAALAHLPVVSSIIPVRCTVYVFLCSALLAAAALDHTPASTGVRRGQRLLVALAVVSLLPAAPHPSPALAPSFFLNRADLALLPPDGAVLTAPWPSSGYAAPMLWQAAGGMRFRLIGGYGVVPGIRSAPVFQLRPPELDQILARIAAGKPPPTVTAGFTRRVAAQLQHLGAAAIIIGPSAYDAQAAAFLGRLLSTPARHVGGIWLLIPRREPQGRPDPQAHLIAARGAREAGRVRLPGIRSPLPVVRAAQDGQAPFSQGRSCFGRARSCVGDPPRWLCPASRWSVGARQAWYCHPCWRASRGRERVDWTFGAAPGVGRGCAAVLRLDVDVGLAARS